MKLIRVALTLLHLALLGILSGIFFNYFVPPSVFKWFNFIPLAFPIFITIYLVLTLFWIVTWKKRAIFFLVCLIFFIKPINRWVSYSTSEAQPTNLKIITFNAHGGRDIPGLKSFLESKNPDIVFLQEKGNKIGDKMNLSQLPYHKENRVVAIYSRYPFKDEGEVINENNGHGLFADINIGGKPVRLITLYLEPFYLHKTMLRPSRSKWQNKRKAKALELRLTKSFDLHEQQIAQVKPFIQESPYPVILGGDFNSVPNSYEYFHLSKGLRDAFLTAGSGFGMSFYDYKYPIRIDYLFTTPNIKATSYVVDRTVTLSDHQPVISTFSLNDLN